MDEVKKLVEALRAMAKEGRGEEHSLVMGQILSASPIRVLVEGNAQDEEGLLISSLVDAKRLESGDTVALWPIEDHQRYVVLTRIVTPDQAGGMTLVMGEVLTAKPLRIMAEGNSCGAGNLLISDQIDTTRLEQGDAVALWPLEGHRKYVILARVVSV